ncbi:MAG: hypothetical protein JO060_00865 [Candidatus Eremiobacteraeota bacterium]|nr:hypothetical protein [Candidatus Eremiobacteraeota bacterium]
MPRVVNLDHVDEACDLACVRTTTTQRPANVLCTSAGFGGINAALVFRRA